jgi:hypothetical protein
MLRLGSRPLATIDIGVALLTLLWLGIGVAFVAAFAMMAVLLAKRPVKDLGAVSARWLAEHRAER